ncbi:MAG TPA: hypothetical protein VNC78_12540 [Actinomycetota bacterium]|nr:hypothetical protein [Actinomycetota bacterium]
MRAIASVILVGTLFVAGASGAGAAPKPVTVFEDASGDAGNDGTPIPGMDQGGFDLTAGTIALNGKNLEFTVTHAAMPSSGTLPEGFRFLWHFSVGGTEYRFTAKSFDIGKPDVVAQSGTERAGQVYTEGTFRLEECFIDATLPLNLSQCIVLEYLDGSFDPAAKTFTIILPLAIVKAKAGTTVAGGTGGATGTGCQICWVPHYAERSLTPTTIIDAAAQAVTYKIPKK